jgi:hypothetical protein
LKFIDEQDNGRIALGRGGSEARQKRGQIRLEIAAVGQTGLGLECQSYLQVVILELERLGEAGEGPQSPPCRRLCRGSTALATRATHRVYRRIKP